MGRESEPKERSKPSKVRKSSSRADHQINNLARLRFPSKIDCSGYCSEWLLSRSIPALLISIEDALESCEGEGARLSESGDGYAVTSFANNTTLPQLSSAPRHDFA
jgi:hypothetical protein